MSRTHCRAGRRARAFGPSLNALEDRVALTGVVAFDPATSTLTVTGDDAANRISVTATKGNSAAIGKIVVVLDGQTTQYTSADLKSVSISGGAGGDVIGFSFRGFRPGTINVSGDAGPDTIGVAGGGTIFDFLNGSPTTTLAMSVTGDGGADAASSGNDKIGVSLDGLTLQNSNLAIRGDAGRDNLAVSLSAMNFGGGSQLSVLGGDGNDAAFVALNDDSVSGASLTLDGGSGGDSLAFAVGGLSVGSAGFNATVDGNAAGGADNDAIGVALANLSLTSASSTKINILGRGGDDTIAYTQLYVRAAGNSTFNSSILSGDGNDAVTAVAILTLGPGQVALNLDGGFGTDSLNLVAPRAKTGGPLRLTISGFETQRGS